MSEAVLKRILRQPVEEERTVQRDKILHGLYTVRDRMDTVERMFNSVKDPGLIESCMFEMNALQAQYLYFLNCARAEEIEVEPVLRDGRSHRF